MSTTGEQRGGRVPPTIHESYTPLSGLAIGALIVSVVGGAAVIGMFISARLSGKPSYHPLLLLPMLIGLAMAIAARWRIQSSDGALAGLRFAKAAAFIATVIGGSYLAYLIATELAIRNQAREFTAEWIKKVATGPAEVAFLDVLQPAQRESVDVKDIDGIRKRFGAELLPFRINEIVRVMQRAGANYELTPMGLKDWELSEGGLFVRQMYELRTPEGKFEILLPVFGRDIPELGGRRWIMHLRGAEIKDRQSTSLGRLGFDMLFESRRFMTEWVNKIDKKDLFDAFIETLPLAERAKFKGRNDAPEFVQFKNGSLLRQDGQPLPDDVRKKMAEIVLSPLAININPGSAQNQPGPPRLEMVDGQVRLIHMVEINRPNNIVPIVGYITMELQGDEIVAEMKRLNSGDWKQNPILPPSRVDGAFEADRFPNRTFRVIEIDLRPNDVRLTTGPSS